MLLVCIPPCEGTFVPEGRSPEERPEGDADRCEISSLALSWTSVLRTGGAPAAPVRRESPLEALALSRRIVEQHLRDC